MNFVNFESAKIVIYFTIQNSIKKVSFSITTLPLTKADRKTLFDHAQDKLLMLSKQMIS